MLEQPYIAVDQSRNPFPGLRPFNTDESLLFFGRDGLNDKLLDQLRAERFVAVVGTSGSGKSSFVRAGLLPALRNGRWRVALFRPINNPIHNLAKSLLECNMFPESAPSQPAERLRFIEKNLRRSSLGLIEAVRLAKMSPSENLLIVADQFEEVYRFEPSREVERPEEEASAFVNLLLEATRQTEVPIYVILTMRSDYLGESARFWRLPEAINRGQFLIPRMDDDERREAIEGPVKVQGGKIAWSLVNRLLNDAGDDPRQLPILQHALMRTWEYWNSHKTDSEPLGLQHYDNKEVGGLKNALSIHADAAFAQLTAGQKAIAEKMFKRLTEKGTGKREGRLPATVDEIAKIADVDVDALLPVIEVFRKEGRSFLTPGPPTPLTPSTLVDISHESLISGWTRLSGWVEEEAYSAKTYRRLVDDALLYPRGKAPLTNPELAFALKWKSDHKPNETWARRYRSEFGKALEGDNPPARPDWAKPDDSEYGIAMRYLEISEQQYKKQKAAKERQRWKYFMWASATAAALFFACVGLAVFSANAESERKTAEAARKTAQDERTKAEGERANAEKARLIADAARAEAVKLQGLADAQAANAKKATQRAVAAQADAVRARQNALIALARAHRAAEEATLAKIEADAARAQTDKALQAKELQAERGNLLEEGIYRDLNRNSKEAVAKYKELKTMYEGTGDPGKVALANILIGNTILRARNFDEPALPYFDNVLELARTKDTWLKPSVFVDIGDRLVEWLPSDQANPATKFYDYADERIEKTDPKAKADVLIKAADLFARSNKSEDLNNAVVRYSNALNWLEKTDQKQFTINMKIGEALLRDSNRIQEARDAYQKAAEFARVEKDPANYGDALRRIGDTYVSVEKDDAKALETYNRALEAYALKDPNSSPVNLVFGDARAREAIAQLKEQSGDKVQAHLFYKESKRLYSELLKRPSKDFEQFRRVRSETYSRLDRVFDAMYRLKVTLPQILERTIEDKGIDAAVKQYKELKQNSSTEYDFSEFVLNRLGYNLLRSGKVDAAIEMFKLNVDAYPDSANTYDSLAEGYLKAGKREQAIRNYEEAHKRDPTLDTAIRALRALGRL